MSDLTLYHAIPSRGFITRWMMEEVGEPYDLVLLNMAAEDHKKTDYLAINPMGRVPALVHDGRVVTETAAICAYMAETFPKANLAPALGSPARADYLRWMFFAPVSAEPSILWQMLGEVKTENDYRPFASIDDVTETLCGAVRNRAYIAGDRFSAADVMLGSSIWWGIDLMGVLPKRPELEEYLRPLQDRPAWQRAAAGDEADGATLHNT